jgi:hypothetical protein
VHCLHKGRGAAWRQQAAATNSNSYNSFLQKNVNMQNARILTNNNRMHFYWWILTAPKYDKKCRDRLLTEQQINEQPAIQLIELLVRHPVTWLTTQPAGAPRNLGPLVLYTSRGAGCNHNKRSVRALHDRHEYRSKRRKPLTYLPHHRWDNLKSRSLLQSASVISRHSLQNSLFSLLQAAQLGPVALR